MMNGSYGKYSLNMYREMSNELTTNEDLILNMMANGAITNFREKDIQGKKFYEFSGLSEQKSQYTNIMLASFITAYGRIQLNRLQRDIASFGFNLLYSDTDSVYFFAQKQWSNKEINDKLDALGKIHCHKTEIGKCKYETKDDIGDPLPIYNKNVVDDEPLRYEFFD